MKRGPMGEYVLVSTLGDEPVRAFVPRPLPPVPPIKIDNRLRDLLDRALISLGRWDSASTLLPDTHLFFELEEAPGVPMDDVREVSNYVAALNHGLKRLKENFPLSQKQILII